MHTLAVETAFRTNFFVGGQTNPCVCPPTRIVCPPVNWDNLSLHYSVFVSLRKSLGGQTGGQKSVALFFAGMNQKRIETDQIGFTTANNERYRRFLQSPNSLPDSGMPTLESGLRLETLPALRPSGRPLGTTRPLERFSDHFTDTLATFGSNMTHLFMIYLQFPY